LFLADSNWPREIQAQEGLIVIYQPQPEKLEGDRLYGRAAVALETDGNAGPVFGAIWLDVRLITDPRYEVYSELLPGGSYGQAAIYSKHFSHVAIMRKTLLRMSAWMNYLFPFH